MYIPKFYKVTDIDEIQEFVQHHSFGTLVTTKKGRPIATHLPLQLLKEDEDYYITGHMAYGNPQWRTFEAGEEALIMFQGPHSYISSSWYEQENVPTWNYQAVHIYGAAKILDGEELKRDLTKLMEKYEQHRPDPILWDKLSPALLDKEMKGIVGFKVKVTDIQAAFKMSQNRNDKDYRNIVEQLRSEGNADSSRMADAMEKRMEER